MTRGIILAAGMGRRMKGGIGKTPKSMIRVGGKPLIERNIEYMLEAGFSGIAIVVGYEKSRFTYLSQKYKGNVFLVENPEYSSSNTVTSLYCAREYLDEDCWIVMADILPRVNPYLIFQADGCFYVLRKEAEYSKPDWMAELDSEGRIVAVDKRGTKGNAYNGISHWSAEGAAYIKSLMQELDWGDPNTRSMYWDEVLLPHLAEFEVKAQFLPTNDLLYEFDDLQDIETFEREQGLTLEREYTSMN